MLLKRCGGLLFEAHALARRRSGAWPTAIELRHPEWRRKAANWPEWCSELSVSRQPSRDRGEVIFADRRHADQLISLLMIRIDLVEEPESGVGSPVVNGLWGAGPDPLRVAAKHNQP